MLSAVGGGAGGGGGGAGVVVPDFFEHPKNNVDASKKKTIKFRIDPDQAAKRFIFFILGMQSIYASLYCEDNKISYKCVQFTL